MSSPIPYCRPLVKADSSLRKTGFLPSHNLTDSSLTRNTTVFRRVFSLLLIFASLSNFPCFPENPRFYPLPGNLSKLSLRYLLINACKDGNFDIGKTQNKTIWRMNDGRFIMKVTMDCRHIRVKNWMLPYIVTRCRWIAIHDRLKPVLYIYNE